MRTADVEVRAVQAADSMDATPPRSGVLWWVLGACSVAVLACYLVAMARLPQMDFDVYRMGGQHLLGPSLYTDHVRVLGRTLLFTYTPAAALLFWPAGLLSTHAGQIVWDLLDIGLLVCLLAVSLAAARQRRVCPADWRLALALSAPAGLVLYPVRYDLLLGQVNLLLVVAVLADLCIGIEWRCRTLPRGVLTGLAAAVKLTPLIFVAYLIVSRQWRAARNALLSFVAATAALFALSPVASWHYFTHDAYDVGRIGNAGRTDNQTLSETLRRIGLHPGHLGGDVIALVVLITGLWIATVAYRRSSSMIAVLVAAATSLLVSPISWIHHYVWLVPALVWLAVGADRPTGARWWIGLSVVVFMVDPNVADGHHGPVWSAVQNSYALAAAAFVAGIGFLLWRRRGVAQPPRSISSTRTPSGSVQ